MTSHIANSSGRLDLHKAMIASTFDSAARTASGLLDAEAIDVMFIASPGEVIPEMGVGGYTYGPNTVVVAIDPDSPNLSETHLLSTLIHEFHHAMRWRGPGCRRHHQVVRIHLWLSNVQQLRDFCGNAGIRTSRRFDKRSFGIR